MTTAHYDAACPICRVTAAAVARLDRSGKVRFVPLTEDAPIEDLAEMRVDAADGVRRGWDGLVVLAREVPVLRPLVWLDRLPGARPVLRRLYRWGAVHRPRRQPATRMRKT